MDDLISRQAAIDALNHELRCGAVINQCGLEMAYEIIEDLPSAELGTNLAEVGTDLISKQQAIDVLDTLAESYADDTEDDYFTGCYSGVNRSIDAIKALPSAQPEQRTGKWIDVDVMGMPAQACGQCNTISPLAYTGGGHHYCPNCGAKMEVTE